MGPWRWPLLWCLHAVLLRGTVLVGAQRPQERPPRPAGWSPAPSSSWEAAPELGASGDPEGSAAALAFLQTGDAQRLARVNCSRGVAAGVPGPGPPPALRAALRAAPEALAHAANFLNMLFQTNDIREASVAEDVEWYQALVRSLAEGHPWVRRAVLALDAHPLAPKPRLMLQATKGDGEILLQDVSASAPSLGNLSWDNEWFNALKSQRTPLLRKRVLSNDLRSMDTPKWQRGDSYVGESGHVRWSPPFLECRDGRFLPAWVVTLSSAFYGLKPDLTPEFKGVVRVDIELRDVAIDQCSSGPGWFADTHRCDLNSTQESRGFILGRYLCRCKPGFYGAGGVASGGWAGTAGADGGSRLGCRPCRQGCITCEDDAPCLIQEDRALRAAVLSCQACCMLAVFLSMLISYHFRRSKRIRASGVVLLETILFGSLLLYFPVFILYFKPSIFRCIVLRWVRMLGFAIVYGTITLKLYRVLKVFLSRTAQRVPYVSSGQVLKMLGLILLLVLWFLAAWTIGMLENIDKNIPLVIRTQTARGLHFYICSHDHWDYMMVIAEMLFLLWGSFLCYATRAVPSAFHEPRYMGIALHNELMISAAFHVVRFIMVPSLHPDWTLLLFFAHTHGTVTMTLALLFVPKFLHAGSPLREEIAAEVYEDELDMRRSGSCLNSSIASAWSEHSLDPDDIREELKKLYVQLEVHKTRRMAANNPHLSKKRSSRRSLGRSIARRVAELPEAAARRGSGGDRAGTPARRGSSVRRLLDAAGTSLRIRDDGSRHRAATLRKSRSTEGPAREPRGGSLSPGEPTPGMKTMVVMASDQSDSESLDAAPLVCKSASAHNLVGLGQPPVPRAAPLQKSLSVVAGAREEALLAAWEEWHASRHPPALVSGRPTGQGPPREAEKPRSPRAADAFPPAGSSKGSSQEDATHPGDIKVQKHVTYAPIKSISVDSSHPPGRVRVAVKRTPPPPPVRYQSLGHRATLAGDSLETAEPLTDPQGQAGEPGGSLAEDAGHTSRPAGKGRLLTAASLPAQVCPWELIQEEILSRKQKATEAADLGTPGDAAATLKPSSQKTSFRSLGLALKAFNRSRGRSLRRRERLSLEETSAVSPRGIGQDPARSSEWKRQRPGSEPTARPRQGDTVPSQHSSNAGTAREAAGWGDGGEEAEGHGDGLAPGTGGGKKPAEEPSAPGGRVDTGGDLETPSEVDEVPPSIDHQEEDERPHKSSVVAESRKAQTRPQEGADMGKDAPKEPDKEFEGDDGSTHPRDHAEMERPHAKPVTGSPPSSPAGVQRAADEKPGAEVCPRGPPGVPAGRGALLRQEAVASREDSGVPAGEESPPKVLEKGGSQPELLGPGGGRATERVPPRSWSAETAPAAVGKAGRAAVGENQADSSIKIEICPWEESGGPGRAPGKGGSERDPQRLGEEPEKPLAKTPELLKAASEKAESVEGRRAEVCPWETGEKERTARAEICPWDAEGAQPEREKREGERRLVESTRPKSLGLLRAQESGSSLRAATRPWGSAGSEKPPPKPAATSSELPEVTLRSAASARASVCPWEAVGADSNAEQVCPWERGTALSDAGKSDDGKISQVKKGISPQRGTGETVLASDKGSSRRGSPRPEEGPEPPGSEKHPALPGTSPKQAGSVDSRKADVCPWEVEDKAIAKTEICPWEEPAAPPGKERPSPDTRGTPKEGNKPSSGGLEDIKAKLAGMGGRRPEHRDTETFTKRIRESLESSKAESKKSQSVESIKAEICPWESLGTEQPPEKPRAGSSALPKSKKSESVQSLKAEICPWELESTDKAEICPWEAAAPSLSKEKSSQDKDAPSAARSPSTGLSKEIGDGTSGKEEKGSRDRESICPWESLSTEQPPEKPRAGSPVLPESASKKSQSGESLKAEICPWELESTDKAEICPWEAAALPSSKEKSRQDKGAQPLGSYSPSTSQGLRKESGGGTSGKEEKGSRDRESICPWESLDTEGSSVGHGTKSIELLRDPAKKSESTGSLKAEICPWEAPALESTHKAEICPWEAAAPPSDQAKAKQAPGEDPKGDKRITRQAALASPARSPEKGSSEREAVCPWESLGTEQPPEKPHARSPALPKSPSKKSQSTEKAKAEICPWEAPELESKDKAEICPWEAAAPPSGKEKLRQDKDVSSRVSKSPSKSQSVSKETGGGTSGKEEKGSRDRESICPWESLSTEGSSVGHGTKSTELLRDPAKKSESTGSLKAEICPWEAPGLETTHKAEICPWEAAASPSSKEKSSQDKDAPSAARSPSTDLSKKIGDGTSGKEEKGSRDRESVCPWESLSTEQPPEKPRAGSPVLPKTPSKKSQSGESLKAEICPWELESTDKTEICPWEAAASLPEKGATPGKESLPPRKSGVSKPPEKGSSEREAICPWESLGTEEPSLKTATGKEPSKESDSAESRKSDICPWEAAEPTGSAKESFKPGAHPQGVDGKSSAGMGKSKPVAEVASSTAVLKKSKGRSDGEAQHKPLCRIATGIQPPRGAGAEPPPQRASTAPAVGSSPSVAEICPWEAEEAPPASVKTSTDTRKSSEVCPWEVESADPTPTLHGQGRAGASPRDGGRGVSETKPDVCPWDHE